MHPCPIQNLPCALQTYPHLNSGCGHQSRLAVLSLLRSTYTCTQVDREQLLFFPGVVRHQIAAPTDYLSPRIGGYLIKQQVEDCSQLAICSRLTSLPQTRPAHTVRLAQSNLIRPRTIQLSVILSPLSSKLSPRPSGCNRPGHHPLTAL